MDKVKQSGPPAMLTIGIIFLIIGFAQQGFTFDFSSGLFNIGVIFTLSGIAAHYLSQNAENEK